MGRVERRMYRRKRQRSRRLRRILLILLVAAAGILWWQRNDSTLGIERIGASAEHGKQADPKTVETREVTLPADTWYAIQTGVFSAEDAARQKADAYTERGAPGIVVQEGEKWRVFIACYGAEGEATAVRTRLAQHQRVDTYLYAWCCPELRLRMTGQRNQLDAVEAGFTLLSSVSAALRDTAIELDAAQLTTEEAKAKVEALDDQIALWEKQLRESFGRDLPALVVDLLEMSAAWKDRCSSLVAADNATGMSAELKAHAMGMYDEMASWRRKFAAQ